MTIYIFKRIWYIIYAIYFATYNVIWYKKAGDSDHNRNLKKKLERKL